uniref:Photosystem II protein N n=1 Tax=Boodleopsis sp. FL1161 TaxID=2364084 RepID=A0A386AZC0_9CHLO|nr:photosystem II protein N [Boodleopsis sp. FL1161]
MQKIYFLTIVFFLSFLVSITSYAIYLGFGIPSQYLFDPFDEQEE